METILRDVRVTLRAFRRSPGFPLTAIGATKDDAWVTLRSR
jgi:hypothetical protein